MDRKCSKEDLLEASLLQLDWRIIGHRLLKNEQDITDIDREENTEQQKREKMLLKWKQQKGPDATYQKLFDVLTIVGNKDTADKVLQMATKESSESLVNIDAVLANCGCGQCNFKGLISKGCPNPRKDTKFMYLETSGLSPSQKDILLLQVKADSEAIFDEFTIVTLQFDTWMEEKVSIEEYRKVLTRIQGVSPRKKELLMLRDRWDEIRTADYDKCAGILSDYYTWFNCNILKKVVETVRTKTRSDKAALLSSLKSYVDKVYEYSKRNIFECPPPSGLPSAKGTTYCVLKVSEAQFPEQETKITAEEVATFTAKLIQSFELQEYTLKLCTVDKGCLQLVYSIPLCVYDALFPLNEDQYAAIQVLGIMNIATKDYPKEQLSDICNIFFCRIDLIKCKENAF